MSPKNNEKVDTFIFIWETLVDQNTIQTTCSIQRLPHFTHHGRVMIRRICNTCRRPTNGESGFVQTGYYMVLPFESRSYTTKGLKRSIDKTLLFEDTVVTCVVGVAGVTAVRTPVADETRTTGNCSPFRYPLYHFGLSQLVLTSGFSRKSHRRCDHQQ